MVTITTLVFAALTGFAAAQTPPGFTPAAIGNQTIQVAFGANVVSPAGELIPRPETATAPTISLPAAVPQTSPSNLLTLFMIDQDVLRNGTRMTLLHWFVPSIPRPINGSFTTTLNIPVPVDNLVAGAPYLQPSPPVGDIPHRYVFLLFDQPDNFSVPSGPGFNISPPPSTNDRIGFNVTAFAAAARLGAPIGGNWITVQNLTGVANASSTVSGMASTATMTTVATGTAVATYVPGSASGAEELSVRAGMAGLVVAGVGAVVGGLML